MKKISVSENTGISMPLKNLISIVTAVAIVNVAGMEIAIAVLNAFVLDLPNDIAGDTASASACARANANTNANAGVNAPHSDNAGANANDNGRACATDVGCCYWNMKGLGRLGRLAGFITAAGWG